MPKNLPELFSTKSPKVYKNKKLNNANCGEFNLNDYQVYLHLISKIGGVDRVGKYLQPTQIKREYTLTAKEFSEMFDVPLNFCYGVLKKAVDKLMKNDITVEQTEGQGYWRINVCSMAKYNEKAGSITIKFTDDIMPYLAQVKEKFVLYNLKEISNFRSIYAIRLYELLQEYKTTGWMKKTVEQLREIFLVGNKFPMYADFKRFTFGHASKEINRNYHLNLKFKEIKEGRKIAIIEFSFKPVAVKTEINAITGEVRNIYDRNEKIIKQVNKRGREAKTIKDILKGITRF